VDGGEAGIAAAGCEDVGFSSRREFFETAEDVVADASARSLVRDRCIQWVEKLTVT